MLKSYFSTHRYFLLFCLLISVIAFGFALSTVAFSIDEETASIMSDPMRAWLHMDRWGMYLLQHVFPLHPPIPYVSLGLGMAFNIASFILCLSIWSLRSGIGKYLAAVFALTHPVNAFIYQFNQSQYGYYLGLLLAILGVYYFIRYSNQQIKLLIPLSCWVLSLSLYQSMIFAAPTVYLIYLLRQRLENQSIQWKRILLFAGGLLLAISVHEGITSIVRHQSGAVDRYHTIASFYGGETAYHFQPFFIIKEITAQLIGHRWYVGYATGLVLLTSLFHLLKKILRGKHRMLSLVLTISALCSPFIFVILTSRIWPARTMMALPILYAGLVYIVQPFWSTMVNRLVIILTGVCLFFFTTSNTRLFYSDYITWQNDKLLANRITSAIEQKYGNQIAAGHFPLVIVGTPAPDHLPIRVREETFGGSIFQWDGGNQQRISALFKLIGITYFEMPTKSQVDQAKTQASKMSSWPATGSIDLSNGVLVVKLSD